MNEALRNLAVLVYAVCAINNNSYAHANNLVVSEEAMPAQPTMIIGKAHKPGGGYNEVTVEQPAGAPNPLGNPIVNENSDDQEPVSPIVPVSPSQTGNEPTAGNNSEVLAKESAPLGEWKPGEVALPEGNRIQNEILQSDDEIIDVQEYPIEDVKKALTPNKQPTIISQ